MARRRLLPVLFGGILLPFIGSGKQLAPPEPASAADEEQYQTFLRADGSSVRVKVKSLKSARVIKKNVSNKSLLAWLRNQK